MGDYICNKQTIIIKANLSDSRSEFMFLTLTSATTSLDSLSKPTKTNE
tara:strand:+ start:23268 stop:23411 length:144 start_codon:yes stop_codon:yes gene_type:complete